MNVPLLPKTLALVFSDVVFYGMIAVFVVGPWIAKTLKKMSQAQAPPSSRLPRAGNLDDPTPNKPNANELAAMRREKLQELARKRRAAITDRSAMPSQAEPANLTMAQRVERARAKAQYKKRAQALQQQRPASQQQRPTQAAARQRAKQQQLARKQAMAQKRAQALQRQHARAQRHRPDIPQPPAAPPRPVKTKPRLTSLETEHDQGIVHRHVPDAPLPAKKKQTSHLERLGVSSLRQAIVLKEILDPPIALRDSATDRY